MLHSNCPCCNSNDLEDFLTVKNAPVQSMVTIKSYEEAIAIPKKDIILTLCNNCGLVFNRVFDTNINHFLNGYEDQQGFSSTFNSFLTNLTKEFIHKYKIHNKNIIEIGCGKGDFIELICSLGHNKGIGIDPAYVPGRIKADKDISFIKDFYSVKYGNLPCDVIVCRHTMEHIYQCNSLVKTVRQSINGDKEIIVFIEVPNLIRILKIQAFWDIFYEHCLYFSPGSLARVFRANGFEIRDTYLKYDDQYLLLEASSAQNNGSFNHPLEESIKQLSVYVNTFKIKIREKINKWYEILYNLKMEDKKVAIWGGGSKSVGFLTHFNDLNIIKHVVDINPHMQGNYIPGIGIQYVSPSYMQDFKPDTIIIMNGIYKKEIGQILSEMNLYPELICL